MIRVLDLFTACYKQLALENSIPADELLDLARAATTEWVRYQLPTMITGLLQTSAYALQAVSEADDRLVKIETSSGGIALRDPRDVAYHRAQFAFFSSHALRGPRHGN